jgi:hypothetical protein
VDLDAPGNGESPAGNPKVTGVEGFKIETRGFPPETPPRLEAEIRSAAASDRWPAAGFEGRCPPSLSRDLGFWDFEGFVVTLVPPREAESELWALGRLEEPEPPTEELRGGSTAEQ